MDQLYIALTIALASVWLLFHVRMLIDCIKNEKNESDRVTWTLMMIFLGPYAVPSYYFMRYRPRHDADKVRPNGTPNKALQQNRDDVLRY